MQRRAWLKAAAALAVAGVPLSRALPAAGMGTKPLGQAQPFDYAWLKGQARALAGAEYRPPPARLDP
jgi:periplasmic glucans biosynthesis protein